jgi:hypothetical protein
VTTAAGELRALAADVKALPRGVAIAVAKTGKAIVAQQGVRIAGPDGLKGKKRRGLKLKARDTIRDTAHGTVVRIQGSVPGWVWVNTGTRSHAIRRRKRGPMRKMTVHHPGTRGRHGWDSAADAVAEEFAATFMRFLAKVK